MLRIKGELGPCRVCESADVVYEHRLVFGGNARDFKYTPGLQNQIVKQHESKKREAGENGR